MQKILVIGDTEDCLTRERSLFGKKGNYEIYWYSPSSAVYWQYHSPENVLGVFLYAYPFRWIPKLSPIIEMGYLHYIIKKVNPSVIHVFMAYPRLYNFVLRCFHPLVVTVMGGDILGDRGPKSRYRKYLTQTLLDGAACITSKSEFMDKALLQIGNYMHKIRRITWGVDPNIFTPGLDTTLLRNELRVPPDASIFFSVRGCNAFYNHHLILEAFARFVKMNDVEAFLLITRFSKKDEYITFLERLAQQLNIISRVRFVGPISHEHMPVYYNMATSAISIPPSDGMPQSLYESMACGCFHILGDLPQYQEIVIHKENAFIVPLNDVDALAEAMLWVVTHPHALQKAADMNRRKIFDIADKNQQIKHVNQMYHELITGT